MLAFVAGQQKIGVKICESSNKQDIFCINLFFDYLDPCSSGLFSLDHLSADNQGSTIFYLKYFILLQIVDLTHINSAVL